MQPTNDSHSARDELFRRIGRNVVNFQYLEATLRSIVEIATATGSNRGGSKYVAVTGPVDQTTIESSESICVNQKAEMIIKRRSCLITLRSD